MSDQHEEGQRSTPPHSTAVAPTSPSTSSSSSVSEIILWSSSPGNSSEDSDNERLEAAKSLLNFSSPSFSPILALKCKDLVPVKPEAQKYLNLQQYAKTINSPSKTPRKNVVPLKQLQEELESRTKKKESNEPIASTSTSTVTPAPHYPIPGRRFLPHQMPVYRPRTEHPNTLTLMKTTEGPLSVLNRVMIANTRVKIWTRNDKGFRGFLTGFVDAFDKHWNIALRDVDEQFVRRRVIKFPIFGDNIVPEDEMEMEDCNSKKENKRKAISSTFIRLQNYLRLNEVKKGLSTFTPTPTITSTASKEHLTSSRSKTVYVGDMDPLEICRTGLAKLSLQDDDNTGIIHQEKKDSFKTLRKKTTSDIQKCHQISDVCGEPSSSSASASSIASSRPLGPSSSLPVPTTHQQTSSTSSTSLPRTRTSLKKKTLTVFKTPYEDNFGFMVVAQTKKYELVERHVGQVLLMGNDIVFIETSSSGC